MLVPQVNNASTVLFSPSFSNSLRERLGWARRQLCTSSVHSSQEQPRCNSVFRANHSCLTLGFLPAFRHESCAQSISPSTSIFLRLFQVCCRPLPLLEFDSASNHLINKPCKFPLKQLVINQFSSMTLFLMIRETLQNFIFYSFLLNLWSLHFNYSSNGPLISAMRALSCIASVSSSLAFVYRGV